MGDSLMTFLRKVAARLDIDMPTLIGLQSVIGDAALAKVKRSDLEFERKFGSNPLVGTSVFEDIWENGGLMYWPTVADYLVLTMSSVNDRYLTGSGAWKVCIFGLDDNFDHITETLELTGATVTTTKQYRRVLRAFVCESGTHATATLGTGVNDGSISFATQTGSHPMAFIAAGLSQTMLLRYTVPNGHVAVIRRLAVFPDTSKSITVLGAGRLDADITASPGIQPWRRILWWPGLSTPTSESATLGLGFPGKTDLSIMAKASSASGDSELSGILDLIILNPGAWSSLAA